MDNKRWENEYRTTVVCIDACENGVFSGRFMNPTLPEPIAFRGAMQFLKEMERMLDGMNFPESFDRLRSFGPKADSQPNELGGDGPLRGRLVTFSLRILFRQNASWQGSLTWLEGRQEESFRSALELLLLVDSVLKDEKSD